MNPGKSYKCELAGLLFPTNAAVERHIRAMFARYANDRDIEELRGTDADFARALFDLYPGHEEILQSGIQYFVVQRLGYFPFPKRFAAKLADGSFCDWSWEQCLQPPRKALEKVRKACRKYVEDQTQKFKNLAFAGMFERQCEYCGCIVTKSTSDVDHIPPLTFNNLVTHWMACDRINEHQIDIVSFKTEYEKPSRFKDRVLAQSWCEYHEINARLRILCRQCNLSDTKKNRTSPAKGN